MRMTLVIIALAAATIVGLWWRPSGPSSLPSQESSDIRPPAPSATEEAGESDVPQPAASPARVQVPPQTPRTVAPRTRRTAGSDPATVPTPVVETPAGPPRPGKPLRGDAAPTRGHAGAQPHDIDNPQPMMPVEGASAPASTRVLTPPALVTRGSVPYPDAAYGVELDPRQVPAGIRMVVAQGRVVLRVLVRADGSVASVEVAESSGVSSLDTAAARAASGWTFVPATRDGEPIDAWALIAVRFTVP